MSSRPIWLVANWKMNGTQQRVAAFAFRVNQALAAVDAGVNAVLCPPDILIDHAKRALPQNARLQLGAQNCHTKGEGAYTGETCARMLKESGCRYIIVGHSERRAQCHETDEQVAEKARAVLAEGMVPIICVGEQESDYQQHKTEAVLARQLAGLKALPAGYLIAYEPVWAIGSGKTPTMEEISTAHSIIKSTLGSATPVLYGGSVKPTNLREILGAGAVDGALIGGASLEAEGMVQMLMTANAALRGTN